MREILAEHARGRDASINVIFVDDREIRSLNRQYLGRDRSTDVIAFDLSDEAERLEGEIYVSVDAAERQAREYGLGFWEELSRLAAHGALHLVGFDDATEEARAEMSREEDRFLAMTAGQGHARLPVQGIKEKDVGSAD